MPIRRTKRGDERTPLDGAHDVLICGASFAGLMVARELAGSGADVLIIDRYEIGERQTSACGIPTIWLEALGLMDSELQRFHELVAHTPHGTARFDLPWSFSTFDYKHLCRLIWDSCDARFETAKVNGRKHNAPPGEPASPGESIAVETDRGVITAPLVVDSLGWRRVLATGDGYQPPDAPVSRGLEVHPDGTGTDLEIWIDDRYVPAGYGWAFPAEHETRIGVGSFDPAFHVRDTTDLLAEDLGREKDGYQGNWIPHKIRPATDAGVFFAGDSAGHCLPLTAEGIRTALGFGLVVGREMRAVYEGRKTRDRALADYHEFSDAHEWKFRWMLNTQKIVPKLPPRVRWLLIKAVGWRPFTDWSFGHYLRILLPPDDALPRPLASNSTDETPAGVSVGGAASPASAS